MAVSYSMKHKKPWCVEFYLDGRRVRRKRCRTKLEAEKLNSAWSMEKATGVKLLVDLRNSPKFRDFVENIWLEHYKKGVLLPTWQKRIAELRHHAFPVFGNRRLAEITAGDILNFQNRMKGLRLRGKPLTSQTISNARSAISKVFSYAKACRIISVSPVDALGNEEKKLPKRTTSMTIWTNEEVERFLSYLPKVHPQAYVAYQVLIQTGMRPSEMRGLSRMQINFEAGTLTIDRQWGHRENTVVDRAKAGSVRTITMNSKLANLLKAYCNHLAPTTRLFPLVTGNLLWGKRRQWMKEAGVRVIRNHDFRHTVAVAVYREGMRRGDPDIVRKLANLLGHRKLAQTYHYLDGLMKLDGPNDAAMTLNWGTEVDDAFIVAAAAKAFGKEVTEDKPEAELTLCKVEPKESVATVYPIHIGRPRKVPGLTITPKSPPKGPPASKAIRDISGTTT